MPSSKTWTIKCFKNAQEALRFAIAFEEGISQQKNLDGRTELKAESVITVEGRTSKNQRNRAPDVNLSFHRSTQLFVKQRRKIFGIVVLPDNSFACVSVQSEKCQSYPGRIANKDKVTVNFLNTRSTNQVAVRNGTTTKLYNM